MITRIQATLSRLEGSNAVLTLEDGQELLVPREDMQPLPDLDTSFTLQVLPTDEAELATNDLAKKLLNQLLDDERDEKDQ